MSAGASGVSLLSLRDVKRRLQNIEAKLSGLERLVESLDIGEEVRGEIREIRMSVEGLKAYIESALGRFKEDIEVSVARVIEEWAASIEEELRSIVVLVKETKGVVERVVEERLERIVYVVPGFELRPLIAIDAYFATKPVFELRELPQVRVTANEPSIEVREWQGQT